MKMDKHRKKRQDLGKATSDSNESFIGYCSLNQLTRPYDYGVFGIFLTVTAEKKKQIGYSLARIS